MTQQDPRSGGAELSVCLTTAANDAEAAKIAEALVGEELVACVNRMPVRSTYRWEGKVHDDAEVLLVMKAPSANRFVSMPPITNETRPTLSSAA